MRNRNRRSARLTITILATALGLASPDRDRSGRRRSGYHVTSVSRWGAKGAGTTWRRNAAGRRLYVTRGTHVMVLDLDSDKV